MFLQTELELGYSLFATSIELAAFLESECKSFHTKQMLLSQRNCFGSEHTIEYYHVKKLHTNLISLKFKMYIYWNFSVLLKMDKFWNLLCNIKSHFEKWCVGIPLFLLTKIFTTWRNRFSNSILITIYITPPRIWRPVSEDFLWFS